MQLAQDDIHPFFKALNQPRLEENLKILSLEISQVLNSMLRQLLNQVKIISLHCIYLLFIALICIKTDG